MNPISFGIMNAMASMMAAQYSVPIISQRPITARMYPNYGTGTTIHGSVKFSGGKQIPYRIDGQVQEARRDRRSRVTSARQQRKERKAWNAEQREESKLNQEIDQHNACADWQEADIDRNAFEREKRADELYEDHFS